MVPLDPECRVEGVNPVLEALRGRRQVRKVIVSGAATDNNRLAQVLSQARMQKIPVITLDKHEFSRTALIEAHQGIAAETDAYPYVEFSQIRGFPGAIGQPLILLLDHVTDPHNYGALLRSAEAAGVFACIVTKRHAPPVTPTVAKSSAGAVEHMRICKVANLVNSMKELKKEGLWLVGASESSGQLYCDIDMTGPIGLVLGSEGKGLSRLVSEECDFLARIPMKGHVSSLNVSTAGAVLMFEARRQKDMVQGQGS